MVLRGNMGKMLFVIINSICIVSKRSIRSY
nr:MAG TPA: hypothetical protein [Caudoviricetes sp.]